MEDAAAFNWCSVRSNSLPFSATDLDFILAGALRSNWHHNENARPHLSNSRNRRHDESLPVVSLFSGGGGLDLGLTAAGFDVVFASDIDAHSAVTLSQSPVQLRRGQVSLHRAAVLREDIRELDHKRVLELAKLKPGEAALLAGGPPCQAFSVFGKRRGLSDPRGTLAFEYMRLLKYVQPQAFVFENVYGLMTIDGGALLETIIERLSKPARGLRYTISLHRLDAVDFGVPQYRDRVFLIGHRGDKAVGEIDAWVSDSPDLFSVRPRRRRVRDALRGLPPMGTGGLANHTGRDHSDQIATRYANLSPGERDPKTRINRLDLDRPSFTIIVGSDRGGGKGHVHPTEPREVTPRESARIQTFPDWWAFSGTSRHPIRQIGNAVPPLLGAAVGSAIASAFFDRPVTPMMTAVGLLNQQHLFEREQDAMISASRNVAQESRRPAGRRR